MEFTEQPKQARVHVPNFEQFKGVDEAFDNRSHEGFDEFEKLDYKTEVDEWTLNWDDLPDWFDWDDLPDWVGWVAQDSNGDWNGFIDEPENIEGDWQWMTNGEHVFITTTEVYHGGWENTLTKRPEKRSERLSVEGKVSVSVEGLSELIDECINQQSTQPHYQTKTGTDFIQRFSDVHSEERVRGALLFSIGKYCERYGEKDDILKEARKIADYANRLVKFEESLLGDRND